MATRVVESNHGNLDVWMDSKDDIHIESRGDWSKFHEFVQKHNGSIELMLGIAFDDGDVPKPPRHTKTKGRGFDVVPDHERIFFKEEGEDRPVRQSFTVTGSGKLRFTHGEAHILYWEDEAGEECPYIHNKGVQHLDPDWIKAVLNRDVEL